MLRRLLTALAITTAVLVPSLVGGSAGAAAPAGGWADMTFTPDGSFPQDGTGTISFGVAGMPDATYTVTKPFDDSRSTGIEDNTDEYVPAGSPFGAVFGASGPSTRNKFLKTRIDASAGSIATVTVTFASPTPTGLLGFGVSDVDVDQVLVGGTRADSTALTGAELVGEAFNLCDASDASPMCSGTSEPFAVPTWDPSTRVVMGSGDESEGEAAWFRPSVSVSTLTFVFSGLSDSGSPSFRLWLTALGAPVTGSVSFVDGASSTPVKVELLAPDGSVLTTTTTAANGTYSFGLALAVAGYKVRLTVPSGLTLRGTNPVDVDLSAGSAVVDFTLAGSAAPNFTG